MRNDTCDNRRSIRRNGDQAYQFEQCKLSIVNYRNVNKERRRRYLGNNRTKRLLCCMRETTAVVPLSDDL